MWRLLLPALFFVAACTRGEAPPPVQPAPEEAPAAAPSRPVEDVAVPVPGDAPLPAADEVPGFLSGEAEPPSGDLPVGELPVEVVLDDSIADSWEADDGLPTHEPTLQELMRGVTVGDSAADDGGESWAFIGGGREAEPLEVEPPAAVVIADDAAPVVGAAPVEAAVAPEPVLEPEDPCAPLRRLLDKRKNYVRRTAAERDTFGYVESQEDLAALRLLQGLHRCAQYPDDEDCRTKPIEVDISDVEIASHQIHRQPSDLNAEGKTPDEIPHDPAVLDLLHQLKRCERDQLVQPLLQR